MLDATLDGARTFHLNLNCTGLDRSKAFYESLGLQAAVHTAPDAIQDGGAFGLDRAQWDAWILTGRPGMTSNVIDLLEWTTPAPEGAPPANLYTHGFQRVGIVVPDLDAAMRAVGARGGRVWSDPLVHTNPANGDEFRLVMASDPDGIALELVEMDGLGLQFVGVVCADLEHSVAWYRSLGFREITRFPSANEESGHLGIDGPSAFDEVLMLAPEGGISVMLVGFSTPTVETAPPRPANAVGAWRLAMLVPDLDAACARLDQLGVTTISPPVAMAMGAGLPRLRFVCFRGPDHEVLELIEQPT